MDDEQSFESIKGSYSYNDVNGQPISLTYTADENGFRPVGAHLPTPPPVPLEILRSLRFLATAKPFVDDQLYDYKPKKKVFRGRQYTTEKGVTRSRNNVRTNEFSESSADSSPSEFRGRQYNTGSGVTRSRNNVRTNEFFESSADNSQSEVALKSAENLQDTTSEITPEASSQATVDTTSETSNNEPAVPTALDALNESKKKLNDALKETLEKTTKLTQSATKETASAAIAAVREEAAKLADVVKAHKTKINEAQADTSENIDKQVSVPVKQSREVIEKYTGLVSDAVSAADETLKPQLDIHLRQPIP